MSITWRDGVTLTAEAALSAATGEAAILNANPFFEASAVGWSAQGGSVARSTVRAHEGTASLLLTPSGSAATAEADATAVPIVAGSPYIASAWVYCAVARTVFVTINWFLPNGTYISTATSTSVAVAAATWTQITMPAVTAPGTAGRAAPIIGMTGTPPVSSTLWIDEATLSSRPAGYAAWGAGVWGADVWGPDEVYADVSSYVRRWNTGRRFGRDVQAWESGSASLVLDNRSGDFSPDNLSGAFVTAGVTQIRPWRPVRIRATYNGVTYGIYRGYALDFIESYTLARTGKGDAIVTVPCADELAKLARFDGFEQSPVGAGELFGRRIHRVLDNAGHRGDRIVDEGTVTMQATTLSGNTVSELKLVAESEGGAVYVNAGGAVVAERQYALVENTRAINIQATFGDGGGAELPYSDVQLSSSGDLIVNYASYARVGGTEQIAQDATSRALYGDLSDTRTNLLCETDAQVAALADWKVARYKDPERRVRSITVYPRRDPARLFPVVLGLEVRDLVRVVRRPAGGHTITQDCFVAGISHEITADDWTTTFELWSATPYTGFATSHWDQGEWGTARWFYG